VGAELASTVGFGGSAPTGYREVVLTLSKSESPHCQDSLEMSSLLTH